MSPHCRKGGTPVAGKVKDSATDDLAIEQDLKDIPKGRRGGLR